MISEWSGAASGGGGGFGAGGGGGGGMSAAAASSGQSVSCEKFTSSNSPFTQLSQLVIFVNSD